MAEPRTDAADVTAALFAQYLTAHSEVHRLEALVRLKEWEGHTEAHRLLAEQLKAVAEELKRRLEEMNEFREEAIKDKVQFAQVQVVNQQIATLQLAIETIDKAVGELEDWRNRGAGAETRAESDRTAGNDSTRLLLTAVSIAFSAGLGATGLIISLVK